MSLVKIHADIRGEKEKKSAPLGLSKRDLTLQTLLHTLIFFIRDGPKFPVLIIP